MIRKTRKGGKETSEKKGKGEKEREKEKEKKMGKERRTDRKNSEVV
jgi:hypothetical protein